MGQQECFILSAFFASGLVFGFYKCVQRLSCLLLKFIQIQGGGGQVLNCLRLYWWPAEWRPDPRHSILPPSLWILLHNDPIWIHSLWCRTSSSVCLGNISQHGRKARPTFGVSSHSSSHQPLCTTILPYTSLTSWKVNWRQGSPSSCQPCLLLGSIAGSPNLRSWEVLHCVSSVFPLSRS